MLVQTKPLLSRPDMLVFVTREDPQSRRIAP